MFSDPNGWADTAKCATMNPDLFDIDHVRSGARQAADAADLCAGCPTLHHCLRLALLDDTVGVVRGGVAFPNKPLRARKVRLREAVRFGMVSDVEAAIHLEKTGLCRKGLHEMVGDNVESGRDGTKRCRACSWLAQVAYRERRQVAA